MEAAPPDTTPPRAPGLVPTLAVAGAALAAGLGVGLLVVGPRLAGAAPAETSHEGESGTDPAGGHGGGSGSAQLFTIDGLIVNPAGSRGQHHLIITVAFEVRDAALQARLRAAEVPLRDALSALLERQTLDELTAAGVRERLRTELTPLVTPYIGNTPVRVFVPQYIVQ